MKSKTFLAALLVSSAASAAANGPSFTAVVDSNGTLERGLRANGASRIAPGQYVVRFTKDVSACAYTAAIGLSGTAGSSNPGTVNVVGRTDNNKAIFVQTFDESASPSNLGFHVIINC